MPTSKTEPEVESLRAQLHELNERSRWYATQVWQVPFAFLGVLGVALAAAFNYKALSDGLLGLVFFASSGLGTAVTIDMVGLLIAATRATKHLQGIEAELCLDATARRLGEKHFTSLWLCYIPLLVVVALVTVACLMLGAYLSFQ